MRTFNSYVVYDKVNEEFAFPFFCKNDIVAMRQFDKFIETCDPVVRDDYVLYQNGTWSSTDGHYTSEWREVTYNQILDVACDDKEE